MSKPIQSLEEILSDFCRWCLCRNDECEDYRTYNNAQQAILDWVNRAVIGENKPENYYRIKKDEYGGEYTDTSGQYYAQAQNQLRANQRQQLKKHGWKEQN